MSPVANPSRTRWTPTRCAICDHEQHEPGSHIFTTWGEMEAWHNEQPSEPAGLVEARYVEEHWGR